MSEKVRILIVDDEKHVRDSISELLIDNGYSAGAAASGEEALTKLKDESFDIALVDVKMPKMSGVQLLEKIKTDHPGVDIIMITGYATINMAVESLKLGAYDFLQKPCDNNEMLASIKRLLEKRRLADELKQAEAALRESEEKFRSISAAAKDAIIMIDNDGNITYWNKAAEEIFGYTQEEVSGKEAHILFVPERYHEAFRKGFSIFKETGQGPVIGKTLELSAIKKDGTEFPIELSVSAVKMQGKWHSIGIARDITERKQAEEELRKYSEKLEEMVEEQTRKLRENQALLVQTGKMAGLGTLAGGIAHEVNNPLASILTYSQLIQSKSEKGALSLDTAVDYAGRIEEVAKHCKFTIQNLLDFSRKPEEKANFFSVHEAIVASVSLLAHQMNLQSVTVVNDAEDATIFSYKNHLMQVLIDVLTNAKDAMPDGGEIRIATCLEDDCVNISISDTGTGIRQEDMNRIFDPFFTTREQGTGLGLYLCYKIMENLGGKIDVKSVVDKGTTITIKLPINKH